MDTLNAFETLAQKVERILEKYETVVKDKETIEQQIAFQEKERNEMSRKIEEFSSERVAVMQRIDSILHKIEELGI